MSTIKVHYREKKKKTNELNLIWFDQREKMLFVQVWITSKPRKWISFSTLENQACECSNESKKRIKGCLNEEEKEQRKQTIKKTAKPAYCCSHAYMHTFKDIFFTLSTFLILSTIGVTDYWSYDAKY